jgi:hypothetical protein
MDETKTRSVSELANACAAGYRSVKTLDAGLKLAKYALDEDEKALAEAMTREGVTQVQVETPEGKTTVFTKESFYASVLVDDRPALLDWLKSNGQGELVKEDVNSSTLRKHVLELIQGGQEVPPMVKTTFVKEIGYRRT